MWRVRTGAEGLLYAYVDESQRSGRYLLCVVVVEAAEAGRLRRSLRGLLLPGQRRLHFKKESPRRRKMLIDSLVRLAVDATVCQCRLTPGRRAEQARRMCFTSAVRDLQDRGVDSCMFIESRGSLDRIDNETIVAAPRARPSVSFGHLMPNEDPLLWLPDCFAWPVGAGGDWLRRMRGASTVRRRTVS